MFDIGVLELVVIAVVALLVFGPDRLPQVAREAGAWLRHLRGVVAQARQEVTDTIGVDPATSPRRLLTDALLGEDEEEPVTPRDPERGPVGRPQPGVAPRHEPDLDDIS